jgi:hypothetical protein
MLNLSSSGCDPGCVKTRKIETPQPTWVKGSARILKALDDASNISKMFAAAFVDDLCHTPTGKRRLLTAHTHSRTLVQRTEGRWLAMQYQSNNDQV